MKREISHSIHTYHFVASQLFGALTWLLDDMTDAGEDRNQETGEMYDSCENANDVLKQVRSLIPDLSESDLQVEYDVLTDRLNVVEALLAATETPPTKLAACS